MDSVTVLVVNLALQVAPAHYAPNHTLLLCLVVTEFSRIKLALLCSTAVVSCLAACCRIHLVTDVRCLSMTTTAIEGIITLSPFYQPFSRWIRVSRCLLKLRMMEVVVTTGAVRHAKFQSTGHHQQTNTQHFTGRMSFLSPNQQTQSTERKYNNN